MKECKRIAEGTCKKCSACGYDCKYYIPEDDSSFGYGYGLWGGKIVDLLPHSARYYLK